MLIWAGCSPDRDDDYNLPPAPDAPDFSIEMVPGDSNRFVLTNLSEGNFQYLWSLPGGTPKTSSKAQDTVLYTDAGIYKVTLYVSKSNGSGSVSSSKSVEVLRDAPMTCTTKMSLLTGGCGADGKCWTFVHAAGAVKVGPGYDDYSWYTSPPNGLQDAQYDDGFCFTFDNLVFQYNNNGLTVDPWSGYTPVPYDPGVSDFIFLEGTGAGGRDQILLQDDQFMGVWDSDNLLDVVSLTETELIVRARQCDPNGVPLSQGWFELVFMPQ
jgi:PKD repeat protein